MPLSIDAFKFLKRISAAVLVVALALGHPAAVLAQNDQAGAHDAVSAMENSTALNAETGELQAGIAETSDVDDVDAKPETTDLDGGEMSLLSGGSDEPSVTNPSFTYQALQPKLDKATGALTQRIELAIPPGRNGVQPDLALEYNSQRLKDSMVGYGWSLSIPYIERLNKTGSDNLYDDEYFYSSLGGELATTTEGMGGDGGEATIAETELLLANNTGAVLGNAATMDSPSDGSTVADLSTKSAAEKASIKGREIAKVGKIDRSARGDYDIEIVAMEPIEGGVQVFARAWDKNGPIGFGRDGTVEIERFRIFNPPVLVPDDAGDIVRTSTSDLTGEVREHRYREDAQEAVLQVLEHTISVMQNKHGGDRIIAGKRGNTTSIFYPAAGANAPVDGLVENNDAPSGNNYSNVRNAATGKSAGVTDTIQDLRHYSNGSFYQIMRHVYLFDTSAVGSDDVSSATLSLYGDTGSNPDSDSVSIVAAMPTSTSSLSNSDYSQFGTTKLASDKAFSSWATSYNNFALNANGLANIDAGGISKFGARTARDISGSAPTGNNSAPVYFADETGTTKDPKLTVEHSAAAPTSNEYRHKVEDGLFISYTFENNAWTAYDKQGMRYLFGASEQAQQSATTSTSTVYRWMLEEIRDPNGNYAEFEYSKDDNQIYPWRITYTGHDATDGPLRIDFATSTRPDPVISYESAFRVQTNYRISEIKASVDGQWVRKYTLTYASGHNGKRSLLQSVQETGRDGSGNELSLPATTFAYASSTVSFSQAPANTYFGQIANAAHVVTDVNRDGLPDRTIFYRDIAGADNDSDIDLNHYPSTLTSLTYDEPEEYWAKLQSGTITALEEGNRFFDINGDGRADVVRGAGSSSGTERQLYLNTYESGATLSLASSTATGTIPQFSYSDGTRVWTMGLLGNMNGDSFPDYVLSISITGGGQDTGGFYAGNGGGFNAVTTSVFNAVHSMPGSGSSDSTNNQMVDINGDGLDDWQVSYNGDTRFCLNTGTGWIPLAACAQSPWKIATGTIQDFDGGYWDRGIRFGDINGDGLPDYIRSYTMPTYSSATVPDIETGTYQYVYLNTGSGWATTSISLPAYITIGSVSGSQWQGSITHNEFVDWTGDGIVDAADYVNTAKRQDVLTSVTYPAGGTTTIAYAPTPQHGTHAELPISLLTVSNVTHNDANGTLESIDYRYEDGRMHLARPDRKFAGFANITEVRTDGSTKTYFHQGNTASTTLGEATDHVSLIGRIFREDVVATSTGALLQRTFYGWTAIDQGDNDRHYVQLNKELVQHYDGDSDHRDAAIEYAYATTTGNLLTEIRRGEVSGASDGTYSDIGIDTITRTLSYAASSTSYLSLPAQETITNASSTKVKESKFYYDTLAHGSVTKGNLTKREDWISGAQYASSTKSYDSYGLVASETDARGKTTSYTYDTLNQYVATSTNPLSQVTGSTYDYATGKLTRITDANNRTRQFVFDPVGRLKEESVPDPSTGSIVSSRTIAYTDNVVPRKVQETRHLTSATSTDVYSYYDGLGRLIQERTEASTAYVTRDRTYGIDGRLQKESLPYFSYGSAWTSPTTSAYLLITYGYDGVGRIATTTNIEGSEIYTFDQWQETATDREGKTKTLGRDAHGNLAQVIERNGGNDYTTSYSYDAIGNLTKLTDALSNVRNFTYDGLSRRTFAEDLHAPADTTFGTTTYAYDDAGNLVARTDPKGQVVAYTYDDINRVLTEDYAGLGGTEISYGYDTCADGVGRLCAATTTDAVTTYAYNPLGLIDSETKIIGGTNYTTDHTYNRQGQISELTYPDGSAVRYDFDDAGLMTAVAHKPADSSFYTFLIELLEYAATGAVSFKRFGNGIESVYTYDPEQLYRLTRIWTYASSTGMGGGGVELSLVEELFEDELSGQASTTSSEIDGEASILAEPGTQSVIDEATSTEPSNGTDIADAEAAPAEHDAGTLVEDESAPEADVADRAIDEDATEGSGVEATSTDDTIELAEISSVAIGIKALLSDKPAAEKASIKGREIAKVGKIDRSARGDYDIEIVAMEPIEGGVQVFARAWDKNGPIGFGRDGTVEIERFRIFNPPVLVPDDAGDIVRTSTSDLTGEVREHRYREDAQEAVLQVLEHTISVMQNKHGGDRIIAGKRGNTTSIFYPAAGANAPVDGAVGNSGADYSTVRSAATGNGNSATENAQDVRQWTNGALFSIIRHIYTWDTSAIGGDDISSATLSLYGDTPVSDPDSDSISIVATTPTSTSSLSNSDYSQFGTTKLASDKAFSSWATSYNNFALNANGLANIDAGGISKFGARTARDISGSAPTGNNSAPVYFADETGTTKDPKLTVEHSAPTGPGDPTAIQDIRFTYDNVGNVTQIIDYSTTTGKIVAFTYDDLYRLTSASTTAASSTPFRHQFSYDALASLTGMKTTGATTSYTYAGTNYANPHAPTTIGATSYAYDSNGNLTSAGSWTYGWNYRDRMVSADDGVASSTFTYDHRNDRVTKTAGGLTTNYPSRYFSAVSSMSTTTAYVFLPDGSLVATVEGDGLATTTRYIHAEHLGSTHIVTDEQGNVVQVLDYYPYGSERINSGTDVSDRQFIGERFDEETDLSYLNARYYSGDRGQFLSQDPVYLTIGSPAGIQGLTGRNQLTFLSDPQQLNTYSYARNNPIVFSDPKGLQSINITGSFTFFVPGSPEPIGPTYGLMLASDGIYSSTGVSMSPFPGPSGSVTYSPDSPTPGYSSTASAFGPHWVGGSVGVQEGGGGYQFTGDVGFGRPGISWDTYNVKRLIGYGELADYLGGPLRNVTTPATLGPTIFGAPTSTSGNAMMFSTPANVSVSSSGRSTAYSSASASISAASAAIGRGDFAGASKHLQSASKALK